MTEEKKEELSPYEEMVKERLELLKEGLDNFPLEEGEDPNSRLPGFIMMHIAQIYTRLDIALSEMEELKESLIVPSEMENDAAESAAIVETQKKLQQCRDQLARELDRAPTDKELADEMGLEEEFVAKLA